MARLENYSYTPDTGLPEDEYMNRWQAESDIIAKESADAVERYVKTGDLLGLIYRTGIADGYAEYRVTKIRPFTIQHVYIADGYQMPDAHVRGLRAQDVMDYTNQNIAWAEMVDKQRASK